MELLTAFLSQQPFLALFLVIALGYGLGSINIRGFSLGVGAVLFSGLLVGAIAPKCQPPAMVGTLGLVMFLYGLGVQFGKQFFQGLTGSAGRRYNLVAMIALAVAAIVSVVELSLTKIPRALMAGLFAGAGTSAATMQAAIEAAKNSDPAVGYAVAFPFGLVGAILCMYFMQLLVKPDLESAFNSGLQTLEVAVHSSGVVGHPLGDCLSRLPEGVQVLLVRAGDENKFPAPELIIAEGDVLFLGGKDKTALESARDLLGQSVVGMITGDRSKIDYVSAFVSRPDLVGTRLSDLKMPEGVEARVMHIQRGDNDMLPTAGITLEAGDRVGVLTDRSNFQLMRRFFGNSMRGTTEFSYISLGIGIMLGVLLGIAPLPVPGLGTMKLGVAGGALIVALILGKLGRTWNLTWTMPMSANLTLRNAGLSIFLAQVGMSSGAPFVKVVHDSGVVLLGLGACILLALALIPLLIGHLVLKMPFDDLLGVTAGVTGTPAILAYAYRSYPSERVEICYAMIYPAATIVKIVIAQLLIAVGASG